MKRALVALLLTTACATKPQPQTPVGDSMIAGPFVATLVESMEFNMPDVSGRGQNDRYKLSLLLHSLDGKTRRTVPIKSGLRASDFTHTARMFEDDGKRLFFHAHEPLAYNYSSGDLSRAEPPHRLSLSTPDPKDFRAPVLDLCRDCKRPELLLATPNGKPQKLANPDGVLLLHRSDRVAFGTQILSRSTPAGNLLWSVDTNLLDVDQILPTPTHTVFIGREPARSPNAFRPHVLVIVNLANGAFTTHPL